MSTQHAQDVLPFLVLDVNSDRFGVTRSYSSHLFLCAIGCSKLFTKNTSRVSAQFTLGNTFCVGFAKPCKVMFGQSNTRGWIKHDKWRKRVCYRLELGKKKKLCWCFNWMLQFPWWRPPVIISPVVISFSDNDLQLSIVSLANWDIQSKCLQSWNWKLQASVSVSQAPVFDLKYCMCSKTGVREGLGTRQKTVVLVAHRTCDFLPVFVTS